MGGLLPTLGLSAFFLAASSLLLFLSAEDRLAPRRLLSINQTIVSAGGNFVLGFFSPGSSSTAHRYVGIWYNNIRPRTVAWVANRENPLKDSRGVLTVAEDGNIVLLDGNRRLLWSSNVSEAHGNASAVLLDTGNLVLRGAQGKGKADAVLWQSFDHPADNLLPEMKLRLDIKTGACTRLVSWRSAEDPSPGEFSTGYDPDSFMQIKVWRGSETWMRGRVWDANQVQAQRRTSENATFIFAPVIEMSSEEVSLHLDIMQDAPRLRCVLDFAGLLRCLIWVKSSANWSPIGPSMPRYPDDVYNHCGPSGLCNSNGTSLECSCLKGFVPYDRKGWNQGNFSGGCVRRVPLRCDREDKFLKLEMIRVPDRFVLVRNVDAESCEAECLRRCNCTAYSYSNMTSAGSRTRCLVWAGELLDLRTDSDLPYVLNVRLAQSELDDSSQTSVPFKKKTRVLAITLATAGAVLLLLGILGFSLKGRFRIIEMRRVKNVKVLHDIKFPGMLPGGGNIVEVPLLQFSGVIAATGNFSPENKLGEGGFGAVYKGKLPHGEVVAVKRLSKCSRQGLEEFKNEVGLIARLQHKNIVQLLGWCLNEDEKILIYEYMANRSLDKFIFDRPEHFCCNFLLVQNSVVEMNVADAFRGAELDWWKRFHIIKGISQGILYLHQLSRLHVVHRDLKTSNVLLDGGMNAKISDFGLARMFKGSEKEANTVRIVGTYGYMSPEYALDGNFSEKSDVFSFGVMLLEIISGRRNTGFYPDKGSLNLLGQAWKLWNEDRGLELMDPSLGDSSPKEEVSRCIHIALMCIQEAATARPTTSEIVAMLGTENASLPPPKQPAFFSEHRSYPQLPKNGSKNFMTISSIDGR